MADAITRMRKAVRSEHVDVRMNTHVGGTMMTFIKEQVVGDNDDYDQENQASSNWKSSPVEISKNA